MEDPEEYYQNRGDYSDVRYCKCNIGTQHFNRTLNRWVCDQQECNND